MVIEKTPADPLPTNYRPTGGSPYRFGTRSKETWQSIADDHGLGVWELIEFNFPTVARIANLQEKCAVVNWYLRRNVGCTISNDGKNWSFEGATGQIYLPAIKPPDSTLKRTVLDILADPVLPGLTISFGGRQFYMGRLLARVAGRIIDDDITVQFDSALQGWAEYDHNDDRIYTGFECNPTLEQRGGVVHEAVHAGLDLRAEGTMLVVEDESLAYVTQSYFLYNKLPADWRLTGEWAEEDQVFKLAWDIADVLFKRRQPEELLWNALDSAIRRHPKYRARATDETGYNGVRRKSG
ncbi:MAG: hypothetical protein L0Y72_10415 [Gemmataceae bacterium]|nr:hypothetical protein [Gemmataceae bacterium]MCI0739446.1 hypothetical protein [Gemmataceae bacterium]